MQPDSVNEFLGTDQPLISEVSEVKVTAVLSRTQARLRSISRAWCLEGLDGCCILKLPPHVVDVVTEMRRSVFDSQMVPKSWAMEFCTDPFLQPGFCLMGHLDFRFPKNLISNDMARLIDSLRGTVQHLLRLCGVTLEEQQEYQISDIFLHVSFQRSQRQPFQSGGHTLSGPFEEIYLVYPLCRGRPIAFWNSSLPLFRDGSPPTWIPEVCPGHVMVFTEIPFCFLSTTKSEEGCLSNAWVVIRVSAKAGYIASNSPCQVFFNDSAEHLLLLSTHQPPVTMCVLCKGPIRERRHGVLGGPRDLQNLDCSLFHCVTCRLQNPMGEFYLCEFCVRATLSPFSINEAHVMSKPPHQCALRLACEKYYSNPPVCSHNDLRRNNLVDTLFLLIRPHELIAGARVFLDFNLNATWHEAFVPKRVRDCFDDGKMQDLWTAFYQCFVENSQCPRVRMTCYAIQCAMNASPVMRRQGTSLPTHAREIYFSGDLRSRYNRHGIDVCIIPRVLNVADFAHGLFSFDVLKVMAIRIFKILSDSSKFSPSYACCCSEPSQRQTSYKCLSCQSQSLIYQTTWANDIIAIMPCLAPMTV